MQDSETFHVSEETVTLARACRKPLPEEELPMLDMSSKRAPDQSEEFNVDIAREAIGERLLRLIGTIVRWEATINPRSNIVTFAHSDKGKMTAFTKEVYEGIAERLGLDPQHQSFPLFLQKLSDDLRSWLPQNSMGLTEEPDGSISCTCPVLTPVLDPLEEDNKTP